MPLADPVQSPTTTNPLLSGIIWGDRWQSAGQQTQLRIHLATTEQFAFQGQTSQALNPLAEETAAFNTMLALYERIINVDFQVATNINDADIVFAFVAGTDPTIAEVEGTLGIADAPDRTVANFRGAVLVNRDAYQNQSTDGLVQGGYDFITLMHEFGHALGLAHPHDTGGTSTVYPGVTPNQSEGDLGDFNLNQGVYTMMSYNNSWQSAPQGPVNPANFSARGFEGTPMAIDIAALQFLYGANTTYNNTSTVYTLPTANATGSFYSSIWDTGGIDEIRQSSNTNSTIDLRAATITVANGGGGFMSFVNGIDGGFTIAQNVVIENATGGGGIDTLIGNAANNVLRGNGAADSLSGNDGSDSLFGGLGGDALNGGDGFDYARYDDATAAVRASLVAAGSNTGEAAGDTYVSIEGLIGGASNDVLYGNGVDNILSGNNGNDTLFGGLGADSLRGGDGIDYARYDDANYGNLVLSLANAAQNQGTGAAGDLYNGIEGIIAGAGNDRIGGNGFVNFLYGLGGNDIIAGNGGNDSLFGGAGLDTFVFNTALNATTNVDIIGDFVAADDTIQIDRSFFSNALALGALSADAFNTGAAASDTSDRFIYNTATGALSFDADGNGNAFDLVRFATLTGAPTLNAADFIIVA